MGPVLLRSKHVIGKCPQRRASQHLRLDPGRQHFEEGTNPICSMVLEYAHQHLPWKSPSFVGKYSIHEAYGNATSLPFCPTNVGENRWLDDIIPSTNSKQCVAGMMDYHTISTVEHQNNIENQQHAWNHLSIYSIFPNIISPVNPYYWNPRESPWITIFTG